jgi:hypothetical protein
MHPHEVTTINHWKTKEQELNVAIMPISFVAVASVFVVTAYYIVVHLTT